MHRQIVAEVEASMEKCFEFVIHIYDGNGEKWYYGDGELVATETSIEGYIFNDYLLLEQNENNSYTFLFYNYDLGILFSTEIFDLELTFPENYIFTIEDSDEISMVVFEVDSIIKDFERCMRIKDTLQKVKNTYK